MTLDFKYVKNRASSDFFLILNLDFDCTLSWISSHLEGVDSVFQLEAMSDKRFDIDEPT